MWPQQEPAALVAVLFSRVARAQTEVLSCRAWAQQHWPPLTSEPGRHGTWDAVGNVLPDSERSGRAARRSPCPFSLFSQNTVFTRKAGRRGRSDSDV